ncbi:MAG: hypothetical protein LC799_01420 [Actinobacteria bacterium]|nr:hypothetical protein [Actinomycetota bacterium]
MSVTGWVRGRAHSVPLVEGTLVMVRYLRGAVPAVAAMALVVAGACDDQKSAAPRSRPTSPASAAASTTTVPPTLQQWVSRAQQPLNDVAAASEGLRTLAPSWAVNRAVLETLADAAGRAVASFRSQPPPTTGQAEVEGFIQSVGALEGQARAASSCESACNEAYRGVLSAQESLRAALENVLRVVQAGG